MRSSLAINHCSLVQHLSDRYAIKDPGNDASVLGILTGICKCLCMARNFPYLMIELANVHGETTTLTWIGNKVKHSKDVARIAKTQYILMYSATKRDSRTQRENQDHCVANRCLAFAATTWTMTCSVSPRRKTHSRRAILLSRLPMPLPAGATSIEIEIQVITYTS
jgi:hypothetical protein